MNWIGYVIVALGFAAWTALVFFLGYDFCAHTRTSRGTS